MPTTTTTKSFLGLRYFVPRSQKLHLLPSITNNVHSNKTLLVPIWSFDMYLSFWQRNVSLLSSADSQSTKIDRFRTCGRPCISYVAQFCPAKLCCSHHISFLVCHNKKKNSPAKWHYGADIISVNVENNNGFMRIKTCLTVCQKGVKKKKNCQALGHIFLV